MEMWVCGEDVKNYWRVKWISKTFRIVYSDSVRKQMDCECMDVCVCRQGCLGASAWTYAHRGRRRASIRGMVVQALGMRIRIRKACHSRGTISWRERRSRRSIVSLPSVLFLRSEKAWHYFICACVCARSRTLGRAHIYNNERCRLSLTKVWTLVKITTFLKLFPRNIWWNGK